MGKTSIHMSVAIKVRSAVLILLVCGPVMAQGQAVDPANLPIAPAEQDDVVVEPDSGDKRPDSQRPVLGAIFQPATVGMTVQSVFTNGPFHLQKIASENVLLELDKTTIKTQQDINRFLIGKKVGDSITAKILRDGKESELPIQLISREQLLKVSNTDGQRQANISRQYVRDVGIPAYSPDLLERVDQRLKSMQDEIESLRIEINRLRKDELERQQQSRKEG